MGLVTSAAVKDFANVYPDSDTVVDEVNQTAEEIVIGYLGYHPLTAEYLHDAVGLGDDELYLQACPVAGELAIGENVYIESSYIAEQNVVKIPDFYFTYKDRFTVGYTAGYPFGEIPAIILHTITQIAALLLTERGNIGISGMSDANTGSRTFISYTNFDKYLKNLKPYRLRKPLI